MYQKTVQPLRTGGFKYHCHQPDGCHVGKETKTDTRRWRTFETEGRISVSYTFSTISIPDDELRRCHARPEANAVYARESSLYRRFRNLFEVGR